MAKIPDDWRSPFFSWPAWMCPTCQKSTLVLMSDTLKEQEIGSSKEAHDHEAWDPSWIRSRFSVLFRCANNACSEVVCCVGDMIVDDDYVGGYQSLYEPKYFYPSLNFFRIVDQCPEEIQHQLRRAFSSAWSDTAATVNALRSTLEAILTERRTPRTTVGKNGSSKGKRIPLNLQSRIDRYVVKDPGAADLMKALRWLGNNGSHAHGTAHDMAGLLDAFTIVEHVIEHIYVKHGKAVAKLAKSVIKTKGKPRKAPNKRGKPSF